MLAKALNQNQSHQALAPPPATASAESHPVSPWTRKDGWIALALAAISIVYLWPFRSALTSLDPDEGIILQGAERILNGQLPYRDFFSFYTPGSYYWNAFLLRFLGDSVLVPRTVLLVYGAFFSALTFVLARRLGSRVGAVFATTLLLVCCLPLRFLIIHNWDATVAGLLAFYCAVLFVERPGNRLAALVGLLTALTILFNQARGIGLLLGFALGFLLLRLRMGGKQLKTAHFVCMSLGLLLPLILTAALFAAHGGLGSMVACLLWPLHHYTVANHVPYGYVTMHFSDWRELFGDASPGLRALRVFVISPAFIVSALPVFVVLVAASCVLTRRPGLPRQQVSMVILCGAVVLGSLLSVEATRPDFHHLTFIAPLFFFVLPWMVSTWAAPFPSLRKAEPVVMAYVLIAFAAYGISLMWAAKNCTISLETRRGNVRIAQANETVPFIQANFPAGSALLVHPYRPLYSFLTRTVSPLRYDYFQPGMHTREQGEEAARQLATLQPAAVLFERDFAGRIPDAWPHTSFSAVQDPIADYIARHYRVCRVLDRDSVAFLFMVRKDLDCKTTQR